MATQETSIAGDLGFEQFLELIPDAIVVIRNDGTIAVVNEQAEKLFGYPRGELFGKPIGTLVPESRRQRHSKHREKYFSDPRKRPMGLGLELAGRRKDGSEFPADISLSAIYTGNGTLAAAAVRDLSGRLEAERERRALEAEALEAREQQARRLESIGELAGGIAHDFNNLLAVIRSNAELALEGAGEEGVIPADEAELIREELDDVKDAADHASKLTSQLLVFSRREVTPRELVDLNEVVHGIERLLERSIGEQIELNVHTSDDLPEVMADRNQMEQILLNLAINARDAMPHGGRLSIATAVAELDEEYIASRPDVSPGIYVRLTVADEGIGMPREVAARAFEPFFTTKDKGEGTGLGLATVYGIVKSSGGHTSIYSEEGGGTVIRVHLPPAEAAPRPEAAEVPGESRRRGDGQRILVAEDADRVRRTVSRILKRGGYEVVAATGGDEALALLRDEDVAIDLLLTDVVMPGLAGTELAERAHAISPALPVLFMSGYADVATPVDVPEKLIEKPFTTAGILGHVAEALDGRGP